MAFTAAERVSIARYLGVPVAYRSAYMDIESRIDQLQATVAQEDAARVLLVDMATLETELRSAWPLLAAKRVEGIELGHRDHLKGLRSEGTRLAKQLAGMMDLSAHGFPVEPHVFSGGGAGMGKVVYG